jgi:hypothetical protein
MKNLLKQVDWVPNNVFLTRFSSQAANEFAAIELPNALAVINKRRERISTIKSSRMKRGLFVFKWLSDLPHFLPSVQFQRKIQAPIYDTWQP